MAGAGKGTTGTGAQVARAGGEVLTLSLSDYVRALSAGARCFCCGKALQIKVGGEHSDKASAGAVSLCCPHCGSEVIDVEVSGRRDTVCEVRAEVQRTAA